MHVPEESSWCSPNVLYRKKKVMENRDGVALYSPGDSDGWAGHWRRHNLVADRAKCPCSQLQCHTLSTDFILNTELQRFTTYDSASCFKSCKQLVLCGSVNVGLRVHYALSTSASLIHWWANWLEILAWLCCCCCTTGCVWFFLFWPCESLMSYSYTSSASTNVSDPWWVLKFAWFAR